MTAHECEEYMEEPPQRKRYAFRKPERQRDFLRLKLTLPSERRTGKPPPDPLLVLCRLQVHRGSRCSTVTKIPDTTIGKDSSVEINCIVVSGKFPKGKTIQYLGTLPFFALNKGYNLQHKQSVCLQISMSHAALGNLGS